MEILEYPNPGLKERAKEIDPDVESIDVASLVKRMAEAMYAAPGVGLAATQLGVQKRVIVFDLDHENLHVLLNPEIVEVSEETCIEEEGCLSVPGIVVPIERPAGIVCEGATLAGAKVRLEANDMLSRVLQHEVDHLDGVVILDRADPADRKEALKQYHESRSL
jgi:peptide deformylase